MKIEKLTLIKILAIVVATIICAVAVVVPIAKKNKHVYDTVIVVAPTCVKEGYTVHACECGKSYTTDVTPKIPHQIVDLPRIEPTCFSNGYTEGKQCEICSLVTKPREEIEALNIEHNFVDRVCANCGVADDSVFLLYFLQNIYIDDVKYTCDIDSLKKTNAHHPYAEEIVLPRTINIYGDEYSVVYLEDNLFSEYVSTKYITIQDTVNYIGEKVFRGAKALERIAVDDNNLTYCDVDYVLYTKDKTGLLACPARKQNVVIEKEVKTISEGAFGDCAILGSIFYKGSAQDKQNIIINQDNGPLDSTRWYFYSQERPSESGDFWRYVNGVPTIWN